LTNATLNSNTLAPVSGAPMNYCRRWRQRRRIVI